MGYGHSSEQCNTGNDIDEKIKKYINSYEYSKDTIIIIVDVSMSYEVASILDNLPNTKIMIDHHQTAIETLNKNNPNKEQTDFKWAYVKEGDSATLLVHRYLLKRAIEEKRHDLYDEMVKYNHLVKLIDLWDTKSRDSEEYISFSSEINEIVNFLSALGTSEFKARFFINPSTQLTEVERAKLDTTKRIKDNVVKYITPRINTKSYMGELVEYAVCFSGVYRSEIADAISRKYPKVLFVVIINMDTCRVSFRRNSFHKFKSLDLTHIVYQFSSKDKGGGHPFACAFAFDIGDFADVVTRLLKGDFSLE
jgi:nanoRNase/pAp phosphatase (c-di-AMP/oligoRNAs hydrolase)